MLFTSGTKGGAAVEGSPDRSAVHVLEGDGATRGRRGVSLREQTGVVGTEGPD